MTSFVLASYAITGRREIWPLLVVAGLVALLVTGLLVAQLTDPDRRRRAVERRALIAGVPSIGPDADAHAPEKAHDVSGNVDVPHQDRRSE